MTDASADNVAAFRRAAAAQDPDFCEWGQANVESTRVEPGPYRTYDTLESTDSFIRRYLERVQRT